MKPREHENAIPRLLSEQASLEAAPAAVESPADRAAPNDGTSVPVDEDTPPPSASPCTPSEVDEMLRHAWKEAYQRIPSPSSLLLECCLLEKEAEEQEQERANAPPDDNFPHQGDNHHRYRYVHLVR